VARKVNKKEQESTAEVLLSRKDFLRENIVEHLEKTYPETERKFDMTKVCEINHTRGTFRNFMDGDFKAEDKKIFNEILQDLKKEGVLFHVAGKWWARLK
jgi:hypothetical protein